MSLQQFLQLADCRVGQTQWSRQTVPESGSSDLEGPVTEACVSARDHTGGDISQHLRQAGSRRTSSEVGPISYRFRDRRRFQLKIAKFSHPLLFCVSAEGVPFGIGYWRWGQTTRMMGLPDQQRSLTIIHLSG